MADILTVAQNIAGHVHTLIPTAVGNLSIADPLGGNHEVPVMGGTISPTDMQSFNGESALSIAMYIRPPTVSGTRYLFYCAFESFAAAIRVFLVNDGVFVGIRSSEGGSEDLHFVTSVLSADTWTFIGVTIDPDSEVGIKVGSALPNIKTIGLDSTFAWPFVLQGQLGRTDTSTTSFFLGHCAYFSMFNSVVSNADFESLRTADSLLPVSDGSGGAHATIRRPGIVA